MKATAASSVQQTHGKPPSGGVFQPTAERFITLTADDAKAFLRLNVFEGQRKPRPSIHEAIRRAIVGGRWYGNRIAVADLGFDYFHETPDGQRHATRRVLVNGAHTCRVTVETGIETSNVYQEFRCPDKAALSRLFEQFDNPVSSRTSRDRCGAWVHAMPDKGWTAETLALASVAVAAAEHGLGYRGRATGEERVELLRAGKCRRAGRWLLDALLDKPRRHRHLTRAVSVLSTAVETFLAWGEDDANRFWSPVKDGAGLAAGSPQLALRELLMRASTGNTAGRPGVEVLTDRRLKVRCVQAANAWRAGKDAFRWPRLGDDAEVPALAG